MTEDYNCKLCGKHFADEDDYKNHGEQDHPEFNEMYGEAKCDDCGEDYDSQYVLDKHKNVAGHEEENDHPRINISYMDKDGSFKSAKNLNDVADAYSKDDADEIEQQEDKPTQSHDDWTKDLDSMRDQYSTEEVLKRATEQDDVETGWLDPDTGELTQKRPTKGSTIDPEDTYGQGFRDNPNYKKDAEEEGGADDPLKKVADLAESYRFMSRDKRASLFESLEFTQGDSAILAGLEWNELTRPIKVEASEAFAKEDGWADDQHKKDIDNFLSLDDDGKKEWNKKVDTFTDEAETGEDPVGGNEDEAYEALYNIEKNHSSPDYKKKAIECNRCNEKFYNFNDKAVHFNEVHATEQEYELPDQCPFCKEIIQEPETLDWHMTEQHGAHVPSQFTQTGVSAGMADTDFDALEAWDSDWACPRCGNKNVKTKYDENSLPVGRECPKCGLGKESYAKEGDDEQLISQTFWSPYEMRSMYGMDTDDADAWSHSRCKVCGNDSFIQDYDRNEMIEHAKQHYAQESYKKGSYAREGVKEDIYNFIKIQGEVPAYPSMLTGLGINVTSEELMYIIDELEAEGKITAGFQDRRSQEYPDERSPWRAGSTRDDFNDSGEWTWKAEAKEGYGDLLQSQKRILDDYLNSNPEVHNVDDMDYDVWEQVKSKKDSEFLHDAINRYIDDHMWGNESYATEYGKWWDKETRWESGMDQDFLYCNHCGQDLYAIASWVPPLNNVGDDKMNKVVPDHLASHGVTESYAKEGGSNYPDEDEYTDSEFGSTRPREQRADEDHYDEQTGYYVPDNYDITQASPAEIDDARKQMKYGLKTIDYWNDNKIEGDPKSGVPWQAGGESRATPGFDTNCTDGEPHEPAYKSSTGTDLGDTTCVKCGKTIGQTGEGSGYWFTPEDYIEWDRAINNLDEYGNIVRESYAKENDDDLILSEYKLHGEKPYSEKGFQDFVETNYPYMLTPSESRHVFQQKTGESRSSDLRKEIKKKEKFINMASFENPLNMGDDEAKLADMKAELASLGESLIGKEFGDYEVDCDCDKDPNCKTCGGKGTNTWSSSVYQGDEGEGGHQDLEDTTEYIDDPEEDDNKDEANNSKQEAQEEDNYVDDSDNAGELYFCDDCNKEFKSDTALQEHQYSYYHGDYKDDDEGATSPRNVMGGQ